jgi:hypothetical protein
MTIKHYVSEKFFVFPSSGKETPILLGLLERTNVSHCTRNEGGSLPSSEDGNTSRFRNAVFSSYSEFPTIVKVYTARDSECYTPLSESFRLYLKGCWTLWSEIRSITNFVIGKIKLSGYYCTENFYSLHWFCVVFLEYRYEWITCALSSYRPKPIGLKVTE